MTLDEFRREFKTDLQGLRIEQKADIARVADGLVVLHGEMAALQATVTTGNERREGEISALFAKLDRQGDEIAAIKADYTPRHQHTELAQGNETDHREFRAVISTQAVSVGRIAAVLSLVLGGGGIAGYVGSRAAWPAPAAAAKTDEFHKAGKTEPLPDGRGSEMRGSEEPLPTGKDKP